MAENSVFGEISFIYFCIFALVCCLWLFFCHFFACRNLERTTAMVEWLKFFAGKDVAGACHKDWRCVLIDGHFLCTLLSCARDLRCETSVVLMHKRKRSSKVQSTEQVADQYINSIGGGNKNDFCHTI